VANILIVDDNPDAGEGLAKVLQNAGHHVTTAANGRLALTHVLNQTPDVVLLDLMMPDMDGPSFLEVVRLYLRLQSLPVVVLTALADSPMIERIRALKVNTILMKGKASSTDILQAIEQAVIRVPG
jgi:CheY-like chemotaxis protein